MADVLSQTSPFSTWSNAGPSTISGRADSGAPDVACPCDLCSLVVDAPDSALKRFAAASSNEGSPGAFTMEVQPANIRACPVVLASPASEVPIPIVPRP